MSDRVLVDRVSGSILMTTPSVKLRCEFRIFYELGRCPYPNHERQEVLVYK